MRASVFQCDAAGRPPARRIAMLREAAERAEADLLVCPELFLSGYAAGDDVVRYSEPSDGPSAQAIAAIAAETRTAIVYGYPETADDALYNAARCIDATGVAIANHRKLVLPPGFETARFSPGSGLTLFPLAGLRLAMLICYDAEFPEAARAAAEAGAEALLIPTALGRQWSVVAERVIPTRAFENGVYALYANHAGAEGEVSYLGGSCIVGPDGCDLARAGRTAETISAVIDPARVAAAQNRLPYHRDLRGLRDRLAETSMMR